jgi:hypothetical protein
MTSPPREHPARQAGTTGFRWVVAVSDPTAAAGRPKARSDRPGGEVGSATLNSPTKPEVTVRPAELAARDGHAPQPCMGANLHQAAEPRRTPRLAARWR